VKVSEIVENDSSLPDWSRLGPRECKIRLKKLGWFLPCLALLGVLFSAPRLARASSGDQFYETIGISIAVGTVFGASTLPFYSQPGDHLINLVYGAALGAGTGLGIWLYHLITGPSQVKPRDVNHSVRSQLSLLTQVPRHTTFSYASGPVSVPNLTYGTVSPTLFWMPMVSLTW